MWYDNNTCRPCALGSIYDPSSPNGCVGQGAWYRKDPKVFIGEVGPCPPKSVWNEESASCKCEEPLIYNFDMSRCEDENSNQ